MPRAYRENISCTHCGAAIISAGWITCPRCHESVQMYSIQDVVRDEEGRWKCQKCLEHGKRPKTLAVGEEIQCRVCPKTKNKLFEEESEMAKAATAKTESGTTKLTTKEYNDLLQSWLREEKKKKKDLGKKEIGLVAAEIAKIDRRIEALERAIAFYFNPDEFERITNVPLRCNIWPGSFWIMFSGRVEQIRQKSNISISRKRLTLFEISPLYAKSPNLTMYVFDDEEDYPENPRMRIIECPLVSIEKWGSGINSGVCFNLNSGTIVIYHDATLSLSLDNPRLLLSVL